jgi:hypothetical protein
MSPKSRRKFNRYAGQRHNPAPAVRSQIAAPAPETKVQAATNIRQTESRASMAAAVASYANVPRELKTIGILAGVLLVVLIALAMILS